MTDCGIHGRILIQGNRMDRILAIDYGIKRMGVAISDQRRKIAFPLDTITSSVQRRPIPLQEVVRTIHLLEKSRSCLIELIIVGHPLMLDGRRGTMAEEAANFAKELSQAADKKTLLFDERLTSRQAEKLLRLSGMNSKEQKRHVDGISATILLQTYLDQTISLMNLHESTL